MVAHDVQITIKYSNQCYVIGVTGQVIYTYIMAKAHNAKSFFIIHGGSINI